MASEKNPIKKDSNSSGSNTAEAVPENHYEIDNLYEDLDKCIVTDIYDDDKKDENLDIIATITSEIYDCYNSVISDELEIKTMKENHFEKRQDDLVNIINSINNKKDEALKQYNDQQEINHINPDKQDVEHKIQEQTNQLNIITEKLDEEEKYYSNELNDLQTAHQIFINERIINIYPSVFTPKHIRYNTPTKVNIKIYNSLQLDNCDYFRKVLMVYTSLFIKKGAAIDVNSKWYEFYFKYLEENKEFSYWELDMKIRSLTGLFAKGLASNVNDDKFNQAFYTLTALTKLYNERLSYMITFNS
jgi:hypothetical protein